MIFGVSQAAPETCAGCPEEADVDNSVVNFAVAQLSLGECNKANIRVENFKSQVKISSHVSNFCVSYNCF